jgi:pimeloyl-ACP methyl ester carboxylesterase
VDQQRRELQTPDGRRLVFNLAGPSSGPLVVFHTGTPGSPWLFPAMIEDCAKRGLRLVCVARPGYGGSDRLSGRCHADASVDTALVADLLDAETFFVAGHSGGGGPALADAARLPDRTRAVAVSASFAPRPQMGPSWWDGLDLANGKELEALQKGEPALRELLEEWAGAMRQIESGEQITADPDFSRYYSRVDRECLTGEYLETVVEAYPLSVSHGVDGWLDDDFALFGEWGFPLAEVAAPVTIWQGGRDNLTPVAHGEWLAAHVPGARLRLLPEEGHVSLLNRNFGAMLDELIELG